MSRAGRRSSPLNIPGWRDFPLRARLGRAYGLPAVRRQRRQGAGPGPRGGSVRPPACRDYIAMVVSTGVGGGIVLDGRLLDGAAGNAGHIGHVIVEPDGRACACGARGCLEAEASGTSIAAIVGRPAGRGAARGAAAAPGDARRSGRRVGRQPARPAARRGRRLGGARLRRRLLRRRPGRARPLGAGSRTSARRARDRRAAGARATVPLDRCGRGGLRRARTRRVGDR